jgi:hypothetical protein
MVVVTIRVSQKELVLQDFKVLFYKENDLSQFSYVTHVI